MKVLTAYVVVGGRLEQKTNSPVYVSGTQLVERLPADLREKFLLLEGFRVDMSSSEIRAKSKSLGSDN